MPVLACRTIISVPFALFLLFFLLLLSLRTTHDFTMNASDPVDVAEIAKSKAVSHDISINEKNPNVDELTIDSAPQEGIYAEDGIDKTSPTQDELANLRRIAGKIPWAAYTIAFVELCERFSYYGTTAVCKIPLSPHFAEFQLTRTSRQFHSASSTTRIYHGRARRRNLRLEQWITRCSGNGPAGLDRFDIV